MRSNEILVLQSAFSQVPTCFKREQIIPELCTPHSSYGETLSGFSYSLQGNILHTWRYPLEVFYAYWWM